MIKQKINNQHQTTQNDIAPCGMNCALCMAFQRKKNHCDGCRGSDENKPKSCVSCIIVNCEDLPESGFCYGCEKYPCSRLKQLDKRYTTKYKMSMMENLKMINDDGIVKFVNHENIKWKCEECGGLIDVHHGLCMACKSSKKL